MVAIYKALVAVAAELAEDGIGKTRVNAEQKFRFRGVDDVMNALGPLLSKHGVIVFPTVVEIERSQRVTRSGTTMHVATVTMDFTFTAAADGTNHTARSCGEGMDMGDKGTAKALSAAYKYAMLQTFSVPVEAMPDADADGPPAEDWVRQAKAIAGWIAETESVDALVKLHQEPRVQEYLRDAPKADGERITKAFSARKAVLLKRREAEAVERAT